MVWYMKEHDREKKQFRMKVKANGIQGKKWEIKRKNITPYMPARLLICLPSIDTDDCQGFLEKDRNRAPLNLNGQ